MVAQTTANKDSKKELFLRKENSMTFYSIFYYDKVAFNQKMLCKFIFTSREDAINYAEKHELPSWHIIELLNHSAIYDEVV